MKKIICGECGELLNSRETESRIFVEPCHKCMERSQTDVLLEEMERQLERQGIIKESREVIKHLFI